MLVGIQTLSIGLIRHKTWLRSEMRVRLNEQKVKQYAREKRGGSHFPAPVVFQDPDGIFWTGDGFHRIEADFQNKEPKVESPRQPREPRTAIRRGRHHQVLQTPADRQSVQEVYPQANFRGRRL
jgi:hypothetical protein